MDVNDLKNLLQAILRQIYEEREASNLIKYYFQDKHLPHSGDIAEVTAILQDFERLGAGLPYQYLMGEAHFYGHIFKVNPHVLIPRPETEELVHKAIQWLQQNPSKTRVLDIGTGSGCIIHAIAHDCPDRSYQAIDIDPNAIQVAQSNALGDYDVTYHTMNFLDESQWEFLPPCDLLVSNPPYISDSEKVLMHVNVLDHEPHLALFAGREPLIFYQKMAKFIHQAPYDITAIVEINEYLGKDTAEVFTSLGLTCTIFKDMQCKDRIGLIHS